MVAATGCMRNLRPSWPAAMVRAQFQLPRRGCARNEASLMQMRLITIVGLVLCMSFSVSHAQDAAPSHRAAAKDVLEAQKAGAAISQLYDHARRVMRSSMGQLQNSSVRRAVAERYMDKLANVLRQELGWAQLREDYIELYITHYTESDLRELEAFYRSPIGLKMVERLPALTQASVKITEKHFGTILPKVFELSKQMSDEMKAIEKKEAPSENK
jgi:uncharacterized protein